MLNLNDSTGKLLAFKRMFSKYFGIQRIGIFGSVARQENREDSDIDIVVEIKHPTLSSMYELRKSLAQLFGCKVDLVRMRQSLNAQLKENIEKDAVYV